LAVEARRRHPHHDMANACHRLPLEQDVDPVQLDVLDDHSHAHRTVTGLGN
jgi:hypothetical protein